MSVQVEQPSGGGLVFRCSGALGGEELVIAKRNLLAPETQKWRYCIVDFTATTEICISTPQLHEIIVEDKRLSTMAEPGMPIVVVAAANLGFGLARMWEAYVRPETGWRTMVVRSRSDATNWIEQTLHRGEA